MVLIPRSFSAFPMFLALDTSAFSIAAKWLTILTDETDTEDKIFGLKVGLELFTSISPTEINKLVRYALPPNVEARRLFLDLKLHDTPNTAYHAVQNLTMNYNPDFISLHIAGGHAMLEAASRALEKLRQPPKLLGVTTLTSNVVDQETILEAAKQAYNSGLQGLICPGAYAAQLRNKYPKMHIVCPGIRMNRKTDDHELVCEPVYAIRSGANDIVVGREITASAYPLAAYQAVVENIQQALLYNLRMKVQAEDKAAE